MRHPFYLLLAAAGLALLTGACRPASDQRTGEPTAAGEQRIISLSGAITETLFALGYGPQVVGVDVTSTFPPGAVRELPQLGHVRRLNVEAVLDLHPDLILLEKKDAEIPAVSRLREAGVEMLVIETSYHLANPVRIAEAVAGRLKVPDPERLEALRRTIRDDSLRLAALTGVQEADRRPSVLFIYARGQGSLMVAGRNTPAEAMIALAGGRNAAHDFEDFKALSPEALLQARPEVLLLFESGLQSLGGPAGLLTVPGVAQTPAGRHRRFVTMEGLYLLGFTPRVGAAALELHEEIRKTVAESQLSSFHPKNEAHADD